MTAGSEDELRLLRAEYDRDGFVVVRSFLGDAEVSELRCRALPLAERMTSQDHSAGKYKNVMKSLHHYDSYLDAQLKSGKHVQFLEQLLGGEVEGLSVAWFGRPEGDPQGIGPHIDALGRDGDSKGGVTIWFALDPVNIKNGCLRYLPGSHRQEYANVMPIPNIDQESTDVIAAELEPGDAVVHSARTVHWSGANLSDQPRDAVSFFYSSPCQSAVRQVSGFH